MRLNEPAARTRPRTKSTTDATKFSSSRGDLHLDCAVPNLIRLLLLIATIMGSGLVQAKTIYDSVNMIQSLDALVEPRETTKVPLQTTPATPPTAHAHIHNQVSTLRSSYGRQIAKLLPASFAMRLMHNYIIGFQLSC